MYEHHESKITSKEIVNEGFFTKIILIFLKKGINLIT